MGRCWAYYKQSVTETERQIPSFVSSDLTPVIAVIFPDSAKPIQNEVRIYYLGIRV